MELMFRWLEGLAGEEGRRLGQSVSALPGRSTFGSGSGDPFDAAEFSEREGAGTLRMAWNVDPERVREGAIADFLGTRGVEFPGIAELLVQEKGAHVQVGVDGDKTKLYAYRSPTTSLLARLAEAVGGRLRSDARFLCVDFDPTPVLKQYAEYADAKAVDAGGTLFSEPHLRAVVSALPPGLPQHPAALVVTERQVHGVVVGHSLHVRVHEAPERLGDLAGTSLAERLAERYRAAARLGLRLCPTYVSWSTLGAPSLLRTAYYRLERR